MNAPRLAPTTGVVLVACCSLGFVAANVAASTHVDPDTSYRERDVEFTQTDGGYRLAGTLTVPCGPGPFPAVVLVSGSGSQDRDETVGGVKPFRVLAEELARRGIVVLRFDDRGTGESAGDPVELSGATTVDLASDSTAAVEFLAAQPEVAPGGLGVVGHSEGALIAPIVANDRPDLVSFLVLLAGSAVPGAELLERQTGDVLTAEGAPADIVGWVVGWTRQLIEIASSDLPASDATAQMRDVVTAAIANAPPGAIAGDPAAEVEATIAAYTDPWLRFFLTYDPAPALADLDAPVLAVFGELDVQVAADANAPAAEAALANNPDASIVTVDGLNHLFQSAATGAISEYDALGRPFPPSTITLLDDWIHTRADPTRDTARSNAATESCRR
jgi:pimeloyl-ACP methyl ester carboxylesterase